MAWRLIEQCSVAISCQEVLGSWEILCGIAGIQKDCFPALNALQFILMTSVSRIQITSDSAFFSTFPLYLKRVSLCNMPVFHVVNAIFILLICTADEMGMVIAVA